MEKEVKMTAIKDCKFVVRIYYLDSKGYYWNATSDNGEQSGFHSLNGYNEFAESVQALENFKEFAKLNKITKYKFI